MTLPIPPQPQIVSLPGRVDFTWPAEEIVIAIRRLHAHSDGKVTAHIVVRSTEKAKPGLLHRGDLNLSATRSKRELAKELGSVCPLWDWGRAIEMVCDLTLNLMEEGEPVQRVLVSPDDPVPPPAYLIYPLCPLSMPSVIYGNSGTLKSTLAIGLGLTALLPWEDNPFGVIPPQTPQRPLFLDWEMDGETFRYRLSLYLKGHHLPAVEMLYRRCFLPLADDLDHIQDIIAQNGVDFLILDSLAAATGGDLFKTSETLALFSALNQLKKTVLILAHTSKDRDQDTGIYGNVFFENYSRSVWEIRKSQEMGASVSFLALIHRKFNISGNLPPIGLQFEFSPKSPPASLLVVSHTDALSVEGVLARFSVRSQILHSLKSGPLKVTALSSLLDVPTNKVSPRLSELKKSGQVVALPDGFWGLALKN